MIAEVYWDLEYEIEQQGFDYAYDKRLYDRLKTDDPEDVRRHLLADIEYQRRLVRFIENHDEDRCAAVFGAERSMAAATVALTLPGLRLVHEGQIDGWTMRVPVQLGRRTPEPGHPGLRAFYERLLAVLRSPVFHQGSWRLLRTQEILSGDQSHRNVVAHCWITGDECLLVVANLAPEPAKLCLPLELPALTACRWEVRDVLSEVCYEEEGDAIHHPGLFLVLHGYQCHIFQFRLRERKLPDGIYHRSNLAISGHAIYSLAWSPDGRAIAICGSHTSVSLVDVASEACVRELVGHTRVIGSVAWCPQDRLLASGGDDRTVRVWDVKTGQAIRVLEGPGDNILTVAWSPDGRTIAAGGIDGGSLSGM